MLKKYCSALLLLLLISAMILPCAVSCAVPYETSTDAESSEKDTKKEEKTDTPESETKADKVYANISEKVTDRVNSQYLTDFEETEEVTNYVKISVPGHGDIILELLPDLAPETVKNFQKLVSEGFYNGLTFHRVMQNFMIQGGDPRTRDISGSEFFADGEETGNPRYWEDIPAEINFPTLYHKRGALAAAREGDDVNPQRRSSRTQFYIVWGRTFDDQTLDAQQQRITRATAGTVVLPDSTREVYKTTGGTPHLDGQYTVFGHVVSGLDVVDKIQRTATDSLDRAVGDVRILSVKEIIE